MIIDDNTFKKKNPFQMPFWQCQDYLRKCYIENTPIQWDRIAMYFELPNWFIEINMDKLDWRTLTRWQRFDESTLRYFQNYIRWEQLNPHDFGIDFLREFQHKFKFQHFNLQDPKAIREFGDERYDKQISRIEKTKWLREHGVFKN